MRTSTSLTSQSSPSGVQTTTGRGREAAVEVLQVGRSLPPAAGSLHPFEGKKCQGLRGSRWELRSAGTRFPPSCTCTPSLAAQLWRQKFLVVVAAGSGIPREGRSTVEWQPLRSPEPAAVGRVVLSAFLAPGSPKGREHLQCP